MKGLCTYTHMTTYVEDKWNELKTHVTKLVSDKSTETTAKLKADYNAKFSKQHLPRSRVLGSWVLRLRQEWVLGSWAWLKSGSSGLGVLGWGLRVLALGRGACELGLGPGEQATAGHHRASRLGGGRDEGVVSCPSLAPDNVNSRRGLSI